MDALETFCLQQGWVSPRGLLYGLGMVLVGQLAVLFYYIIRRTTHGKFIQYKDPPQKSILDELKAHVSAPESFFMVYGYLCFIWMFRLMPKSYYVLDAPIVWTDVLLQFVVVDFFTFVDHKIEHNFPQLYKRSHKFHHRFTNPVLYNAFNGAVPDTLTLILIPLFLTHWVCNWVNNWSFIAFGTLYAAQFTLIHSEYEHPWDAFFRIFGIGTAADHNVHHVLFVFNYGHFFMWWDMLQGTYKSPCEVKKLRLSHLQDADQQLKEH